MGVCGGASGSQLASGTAGGLARCRWDPGWPYYLAASMAHRQRARVTMLRWCFWAGAWFDSGYMFQRRRTVEVLFSVHRQSGGYCSYSQRQVCTVQTCYATVTCTHSANCADDRRDFPGAALGPVFDMPVVVQRHMHCPRVSRSSTSPSWRRCSLLWS